MDTASALPAAAATAAVPEVASTAATAGGDQSPPAGRAREALGPPPGPVPQASGPAYTTYDQHSGAFTDPAGGTGIFAPGMSKASSAENWVDLMRDPRQL
ncbi:mCE-family protein mce4F [Mycobacterium xenopi 3993]|nr:mCE-family protein mce4F [Mycobacterium xenopi 3993]